MDTPPLVCYWDFVPHDLFRWFLNEYISWSPLLVFLTLQFVSKRFRTVMKSLNLLFVRVRKLKRHDTFTMIQDACREHGSIPLARWLVNYLHYPPNNSWCIGAAMGGHLAFIQWFIVEFDLPVIFPRCCYEAARTSQLHIVRWLVEEQDCVISPRMVSVACESPAPAALEVVKYLMTSPKLAAPVRSYDFPKKLRERMRRDILEYLREQRVLRKFPNLRDAVDAKKGSIFH